MVRGANQVLLLLPVSVNLLHHPLAHVATGGGVVTGLALFAEPLTVPLVVILAVCYELFLVAMSTLSA